MLAHVHHHTRVSAILNTGAYVPTHARIHYTKHSENARYELKQLDETIVELWYFDEFEIKSKYTLQFHNSFVSFQLISWVFKMTFLEYEFCNYTN